MMKVEIGTAGRCDTWQDDFPEETHCVHCGAVARMAFLAVEDQPGPFICNLHDNQDGAGWPHDAAAFAVYICTKCPGATALWNQA